MRNGVLVLAGLLWATVTGGSAHADNLTLQQSYRGHLKFIFVGASATDSTGISNGVRCTYPTAEIVVSPDELPTRATLKSATLYVGGSLIGGDQDYINPAGEIFDTSNLRADDPNDIDQIESIARSSADASVSFLPPNGDAAVTLQTSTPPAVSVFYKQTGSERGNIGFFVSRFDATPYLDDTQLAGSYVIGDIQADVCRGVEVTCKPDGSDSCELLSFTHTNGAAAVAMLLVIEDPALPPHAIAVFDGMQQLFASNVVLDLQPALAISDPPAGRLVMFALEGDLLIGASPNDNSPCGFDEFLLVDGDPFGPGNPVCLSDDDNPLGNLFNATINTQPAAQLVDCAPDDTLCCRGDGLCGVTGVDIDTFDISRALVPNSSNVRVQIGSGTDRVAMATLVLGVDVFEPLLQEDSQIRVLGIDDDGYVRLGESFTYLVVVSNTGNVTATDVDITFSLPRHTQFLGVQTLPEGASDTSSAGGGVNGTGFVHVGDFSVEPGQIAALRVDVLPTCDALAENLDTTAVIVAAALDAVTLVAPTIVPAGPGTGTCDGVDPNGPLGSSTPPRLLRGGGCATTNPPQLLLPLLFACLLWCRRRVRTQHVVLIAALGILPHCAERYSPVGNSDPADILPVVDLDALPGEPCAQTLMARVHTIDDTTFCIDRFEAALTGGATGNPHQGNDDDAQTQTDGSTTASASVLPGALPARELTWYQAAAACANAGKSLCTRAQWERACRGPMELLYPYGDALDDKACNGFFRRNDPAVMAAGSLATCVSAFGVFDMSGNVDEWLLDAVERTPGSGELSDRAFRGGNINSNVRALTCVGDEFHAAPGTSNPRRGFRCCATD